MSKYITLFEFNPDDPFINNQSILDILLNRSSEQLECENEDLFWVIDCHGFRALKVRKQNIGSVKRLSRAEIDNRIAGLQGFFWGLTYQK